MILQLLNFPPTERNVFMPPILAVSDEDQPHSLIEDSQGNLVIAGRSNSQDYPTTVPAVGPGGTWDMYCVPN